MNTEQEDIYDEEFLSSNDEISDDEKDDKVLPKKYKYYV